MNKYLEKIALSIGVINKGFSGLGKGFKAVDAAYGSVAKTFQKAFKPVTPSIFSHREAIRTARNDLVKSRGNARLWTSAEKRQLSRDVISKFRQEHNLVKNPLTSVTTTTPAGSSTVYRSAGYKPGTATGKDNQILQSIHTRMKGVEANADRIRAARAKLAIGGTALAGAGGLGYHMATRNNQVGYSDQQMYMP